jgi:hypothetical protein
MRGASSAADFGVAPRLPREWVLRYNGVARRPDATIRFIHMPAPKLDELVLVYRTPNVVAVRSLAIVLEDAGIETRIVGDFRDGAYPGLAIGSMADKELWIAAADRADAETIVAEWRREHDPEPEYAPPRKLQYSMSAVLVAMTAAAFAAAAMANGHQAFGVFLNVAFYGLLAAAIVIGVRRRFGRVPVDHADDPAQSPSAEPPS